VHPIDDSVKVQLLQWLKDFSLLDSTTSIGDLPDLCKDGVVLSRLINRLNGREEVVKGVQFEPKRSSVVSANISKLLSFLRDQPKMKSRCLFAHQELIEGNPDVFWGLLEDICTLYQRRQHLVPRVEPVKEDLMKTPQKPSKSLHTQTDFIKGRSRLEHTPELASYRRVEEMSVQSKTPLRGVLAEQTVMQEEVRSWLRKLKLGYLIGNASRPFLLDPMRNGVLLCELAAALEKASLHGVQWRPSSLQAALENTELALAVFREKRSVSADILRHAYDLVGSKSERMWRLLYSLMKAYEEVEVQPAVKDKLPTVQRISGC
jgi:hypothetical protein